MKTLIVDDNYEKVENIAAVLRDLGHQDIKHVTNIADALSSLKNDSYQLMMLDIQIPQRLGEPIASDGGIQLLKRLNIDSTYNKPGCIFGVTSHNETYDEYRKFFEDSGWKFLFKDFTYDELKKLIEDESKFTKNTSMKFDYAIIVALEKVELDAVLNLDCNWEEYYIDNDTNIYFKGWFYNNENIKKTIIATACPRMGVASSTATTMKVCMKFSPDYCVMTGIAAGIKGKVSLGDILVADICWDWGSGKMAVIDGKAELQSDPYQITLDPVLSSRIKNIAARNLYTHEIYSNWRDRRPPHDLKVHVGPIATGSVVVEDESIVSSVISQNRKTVGIEMEGHGFLYALECCDLRNTKGVVVKSVCDFADPEKNDSWQDYAAYTSSAFAFELMKNHFN